MLNLDTHILLFALEGTLTAREEGSVRRALGHLGHRVVGDTKLHQKGRISLGLDHPLLARALCRIHVWPITTDDRGRHHDAFVLASKCANDPDAG